MLRPLTLEEMNKQDKEFQSTSGYSSFKSSMVSQLLQFEKTQEWADLIKCLEGIIKLLKKYTTIPCIPESLILSKRLAQCLNLSLPPGVHAKAIETYIAIFNHIGERLKRDIGIFSLGLFTFFPNSSIQIKPTVSKLFEDYFIPLGSSIVPFSSPFTLSLLSGLEEEEGSLIYTKSLSMLEQIRKYIDNDEFYFKVIWDNIMVCKSIRIPGYKYLILLIKKNENEVDSISKNSNLLISSIISSFKDDILVQRCTFDLLLCLKDLFLENELLLKNVLLLILKEDQSLNRRIQQYLLNLEDKHLLKSIKNLLKSEKETWKIISFFKKEKSMIIKELIYEILIYVENFDEKLFIQEILRYEKDIFWKCLEIETEKDNIDFVFYWFKRIDIEFNEKLLRNIVFHSISSILNQSKEMKKNLDFIDWNIINVIKDEDLLKEIYLKFEEIYKFIFKNLNQLNYKEYFKDTVNIILVLLTKIEMDKSFIIGSLMESLNSKDIEISLFSTKNLLKMKLTDDILRNLNVLIWDLLKPQNEEYYYDITKIMVDLHKLNKLISNRFISEELTNEKTRIESCKRFSLFWKLLNDLSISRVFDDGLLLMIDSLKSEHAFQTLISKIWLLNSMSNLKHILDTLLFLLIDKSKLTLFDERRTQYILKLLTSIIEVEPNLFIKNSLNSTLSEDLLFEFQSLFIKDLNNNQFHLPSNNFSIPIENYLNLLISVTLKLFELEDSDIKSNCISFLKIILLNQNFDLIEIILYYLNISIKKKDYVLQIELLDLLNILLKSNKFNPKPLDQMINYGIHESDSETLTYWINYLNLFLPYFKEDDLTIFIKNVIPNLLNNFNNNSIMGFILIYQYIMKIEFEEIKPQPNTGFLTLFVQETLPETKLEKLKKFIFSSPINDIIYNSILKEYNNSFLFYKIIPKNELVKSLIAVWYKLNPEIMNGFEVKKWNPLNDNLLHIIKSLNLNLEDFLKHKEMQHLGIHLVSFYLTKYDLKSYSNSLIIINNDLLCNGMSLKLLNVLIKKDKSLKQQYKDVTYKLLENSIVLATKECLDKQKIIQENNLIESESELDLSSQIFNLISLICNDIVVDYNQLGISNLLLILKIYNFENLTRMKSILNYLKNFKKRKEYLDLFYQNQFFFIDQEGLMNWKIIINDLFSIDHQYFNDLLLKFNSTSSIFQSLETEAKQKGKLIKRMAFIIFCGRLDEYHKEIPVIIEKLVESLKHSSYSTILYHVLLCFRVIIYKFSPKKLSIVWPTIITQIIKILEDENQSPMVLLQLSKLIDYCMILLPESFQTYKWIFINHLNYKNSQFFTPLLNGEIQDIKDIITLPLESPKVEIKNIDQVNEFVNKLISKTRQDYFIENHLNLDTNFIENEFINDFISHKVLNFKRTFKE